VHSGWVIFVHSSIYAQDIDSQFFVLINNKKAERFHRHQAIDWHLKIDGQID
jgi:hypothetical protein